MVTPTHPAARFIKSFTFPRWHYAAMRSASFSLFVDDLFGYWQHNGLRFSYSIHYRPYTLFSVFDIQITEPLKFCGSWSWYQRCRDSSQKSCSHDSPLVGLCSSSQMPGSVREMVLSPQHCVATVSLLGEQDLPHESTMP